MKQEERKKREKSFKEYKEKGKNQDLVEGMDSKRRARKKLERLIKGERIKRGSRMSKEEKCVTIKK